MNIKCRSCKLDYNMVYKPRKHKLVDLNLVCPVCNYNGKWASHLCDELWGDGLECRKCHNYILYVSPENQKWKDEIYLPKDRFLIRDFNDNSSAVYSNHKQIFEVKHLIQFQNYAQLENNIRTMVVFS